MKRLVGYVVSIVGIVIMALGFGMFGISLEMIKPYNNYISIVGIVVIIAGVLISLKSDGGKIKQEKEEVPIYEGVGKNRKVVGYRKD